MPGADELRPGRRRHRPRRAADVSQRRHRRSISTSRCRESAGVYSFAAGTTFPAVLPPGMSARQHRVHADRAPDLHRQRRPPTNNSYNNTVARDRRSAARASTATCGLTSRTRRRSTSAASPRASMSARRSRCGTSASRPRQHITRRSRRTTAGYTVTGIPTTLAAGATTTFADQFSVTISADAPADADRSRSTPIRRAR